MSRPPEEEARALKALIVEGRLQACEERARAMTAKYPDDAFAWNILGACLAVGGRIEESLSPLQRCAALVPDDPEAHKAVADVWSRVGRHAEAVEAYERCLALAPQYVEVLVSESNAFAALGRRDDAEVRLRRALAIEPDHVQALANLGAVLRDLGKFEDARACCLRAIALKPTHFRAHNNLGNVLVDLGHPGDAEASYRRALELKPDYAVAHGNLGKLLVNVGRAREAEASCRRALALKESAGALNTLGIALRSLSRYEEARQSFLRAIELDPRNRDALSSLGNLLNELGEPNEAEASYRRALEVSPNDLRTRSNLLFGNHYRDVPPSAHLELAREYGRSLGSVVARGSYRCEPDPRRLRVGLVSGDLGEHVVSHFLESVLAALDPSSVEVFAYPTKIRDDARAKRLRAHCAAWKPLSASDEASARTIHDDGVHVLVDLAGHTADNRLPLFALRPAPVQVTWLGYADTTGVEQMDWILTDEASVPPANVKYFTERVAYLPDTRLCYTAPEFDVPVAPLPSLRSGAITFGCFQELAKINDAVLDAWAEVFRRLPTARLRVQSRPLGDALVRARFEQRLLARGVRPSSVVLRGAAPRAEYLAGHGEVDLILDTFPYPGGTTTCEALWMGVPTVTLEGATMLSRQGLALLTAAGLPDWVTSSVDEYVRRAVEFASDTKRLASLRQSLRARVVASPVFDAPRFARNLQAALWKMWRARG